MIYSSVCFLRFIVWSVLKARLKKVLGRARPLPECPITRIALTLPCPVTLPPLHGDSKAYGAGGGDAAADSC
jgi:hypothetical protein